MVEFLSEINWSPLWISLKPGVASKPAIMLPLVCLLFAYLAARAIFRDELLVRAADRIR